MLGFWGGHRPRFVRTFLPSSLYPSSLELETGAVATPPRDVSLGSLAVEAARAYVDAVHARTFPSVERGEVYGMDAKEWAGYLEFVEQGKAK